MNPPTKYLSYCKNCKKQTPHYIALVSKKRGIKLMCVCCGRKKSRYTKINQLIEYKPFITKLKENNNDEPKTMRD